jgi:hypothetical protein
MMRSWRDIGDARRGKPRLGRPRLLFICYESGGKPPHSKMSFGAGRTRASLTQSKLGQRARHAVPLPIRSEVYPQASWGAALRSRIAGSQDESRCGAIHKQRPYHGSRVDVLLGRWARQASPRSTASGLHLLRKRRQAAALQDESWCAAMALREEGLMQRRCCEAFGWALHYEAEGG